MSPILIVGTCIVIFALLSYTVAFLLEQRKYITNNVLLFQCMGLFLDISATVCMIIGSQNTAITLHGVFGYSSYGSE